MPFIESIRATNVLSFGASGREFALRDLNVLIGHNSSGKSNFVSLFSLLQAAPSDITRTFSVGGGISEWMWKGGRELPSAEIEVVLSKPKSAGPLRYRLTFREEGQRFSLSGECLEHQAVKSSFDRFFFRDVADRTTFNVVQSRDQTTKSDVGHGHPGKVKAPGFAKRVLRKEVVQPNQSVLAQRRGPEQYPEITFVAEAFSRIRIFQDWQFDRNSKVRLPQAADLPNDYLLEDASNLALVIDDIKFSGLASELNRYLELASDSFRSPITRTLGGTIQLFIEEADLRTPTPATRLSQGTLQLLCLLVILLHPRPPKVVCLEEPEKGLHPDILPDLARLLVKASERMQLVVTTHSEVLVDALTDQPESVVVCEREKGETALRRLDKDGLKTWLDEYKSLGPMWRSGVIGGNRW